MAEIPVERKEGGGFPWWLIPLLLLLILLPLLWYMFGRNDQTGNTNNNNTNNNNANRANMGATGTTGAGGNTGMVTNANGGGGGIAVNGNGGANNNPGGGNANSGAMTDGGGAGVNRNPGSVISDVNYFGGEADKSKLVGRGLFVNGVKVNRVLSDRVFTVKSGSGEMFVMLDESLDSGGGKEKQIRMKQGQTVNLGGEFRNAPNAETTDEKSRDLNQKEYAQMKGQKVYLHANSVADAK